MISQQTSQKIKNMSIVCAMLVVAVHVNWPADHVCLTWFINEIVRTGLSRIAVPFFFVVSGFFLAKHFDEDGWWGRETRKRIKSLVVPYFVWSAIAFVVMMDGLRLTGGRWIHALGFDLDQSCNLLPLWYVRCLIFFVLLSPLFKLLVEKFKLAWLLLSLIVLIGYDSVSVPGTDRTYWDGFFRYGFSIEGTLFFSIGIYLNKNPMQPSRKIGIACALLGVAGLFTRTYLHLKGVDTTNCLNGLFIASLLFAAWYFIPSAKFPVWLTSSSFPVFLLHCIILSHDWLPLLHINIDPQISRIIAYCYAIGFSIIIARILNSVAPRFSAFLFANRA